MYEENNIPYIKGQQAIEFDEQLKKLENTERNVSCVSAEQREKIIEHINNITRGEDNMEEVKEIVETSELEEVKLVQYNVTVHAFERYAERVAKQEGILDIKSYVNSHRETIRERINKLINYGELIFTGKIREFNTVNVFFKDNWVILVSPKDNNVVTLYKIDFGDDEVNELFVSKKLKQLEEVKAERERVIAENELKKTDAKQTLAIYKNKVEVYGKLVKENQELANLVQSTINKMDSVVREADQNIIDVIDSLIGKKFF